MLWHREDYVRLLRFADVGRPMFTELFGPLQQLEAEWRAQCASEAEIDLTAFEFDYVRRVNTGASCDVLSTIQPRVLRDDDRETISIDALGRRMRLVKSAASIPLPLDHPVHGWEDWRNIKPWYEFQEARIDREAVRAAQKAREEGALVLQFAPGGYQLIRDLMGDADACYAVYDEPELLHDVFATVQAMAVRVLERLAELGTVDVLCLSEDFAGKSGPIWGPGTLETFVTPYYRALWKAAQRAGARLFSLDSDGDIRPLIPTLIDAGVNVLYPLEPAAGVDMVALRAQYGEALAFKGGIDKLALRQGRAAIDAEIAKKVRPELLRGTVFGLDHRIPDGVPIEDYRYYVDTMREALGLPAREGKHKGWLRMAF